MYGTTMKNYKSSKHHKNDDNIQIENKKKNKKEYAPKTRYMKINERKYEKNNNETTSANVRVVEERFSKKEFPIASVIFTAIATMIVLLLTTGLIG